MRQRLEFRSQEEHLDWLRAEGALPAGFRAGTTELEFSPKEAPRPSKMRVTLIALDRPTSSFAALYTRNAVPGHPVLIGRERLHEPSIGALLINNKISNVGAAGGRQDAERLCAAAAEALALEPRQVLPFSTGVIGWKLPVDGMLQALPQAVRGLQSDSALPAARAIMTTDLYPKLRRARVGDATIVGIAKGAGMIEPNLATLLVFVLTDADVPRDALRAALARAAQPSFNSISIDSDTSTSDALVALASGRRACPDLGAFEQALTEVCVALAEDVVRNGEGVHHVLRVRVTRAADETTARGLGKTIVNSPLVQCAVAGNDPNVGRLLCAIGKFAGQGAEPLPLDALRVAIDEHTIFENGAFTLSPDKERALVDALSRAEMYSSQAPKDGVHFVPPITYPPHERTVDIHVDLGRGSAEATVFGCDRTHEYITENADYRS
ncbi:MAG TPA: bifunctional glutamate N-acetyltransferase/amino-acid acetyltransferase ArgJ [Polyangiaceae bacterium]|nr:bifunctional glutamate N-acetyltransferase/amino-acid acetyltransferase ArgJ [Polyangiaceae bacterium]